MSTHQLTHLLAPESIAVIGASAREGRPGYYAVTAATVLGSERPLYPVTPKYESIAGHSCYPDIASLPESVDLALIAGSAARMESDLAGAIACGARSALIFAEARLGDDATLLDRVRGMAREAGIPLLGPNSIGYSNYATGSVATWIPPITGPPGNVALIVQSGSTFAYSTTTDPRVKPSFVAHPGQEALVSIAELMDYALEIPATEVVALYLETIRHPEAFVEGLEKAVAMDKPVVVLNPGRCPRARSAVMTHAGRMVSDDKVLDALFRRYGVLRVNNMDEWWTTLHLLSSIPCLGPGGLSAVTDSGGQRAVLLDDATRLGIPLTALSEQTRESLAKRLSPGLEPENPVDYWGGEEDLAGHLEGCLGDVVADPGTAIAMTLTEFGAVKTDSFPDLVADACRNIARRSSKPVVAATFSARQIYAERSLALAEAGVPVLDGTRSALEALKHAFDYRDFRHALAHRGRPATPPAIAGLEPLVRAARAQDETDALRLVQAAGIDTVESTLCAGEREVLESCERLGFPVVLKTAEGHAHKLDVGGVLLGLEDARAVCAGYSQLSSRLGPKVTVQPMAPQGVEFALGAVVDKDFGPLVMVAAGGTFAELADDKAFALAPVGVDDARTMVGRLRSARLLDGYRNLPALSRAALTDAVVKLSHLAHLLRYELSEIDINPLLVHPTGALAVDALVRFR